MLMDYEGYKGISAVFVQLRKGDNIYQVVGIIPLKFDLLKRHFLHLFPSVLVVLVLRPFEQQSDGERNSVDSKGILHVDF